MTLSEPRLVTLVQPYVPDYRVPLFDAIASRLGTSGLELRVAHSTPDRCQALRGDSRPGSWSYPIEQFSIRVGGSRITYRQVFELARRSSVVVMELASTNLDTHAIAAVFPRKLIVWGHGASYVTESRRIDNALEIWLARRAARVFTYTDGGKRSLIQRGISSAKITAVQNSTDTRRLRERFDELTTGEIRAFASQNHIGRGPIAAFIGALDSSKRLDLLLDASRLIATQLPDFALIISGDGPMREYVRQRAMAQPEVRVLGRADVDMLANIGRIADVLAMPGRIGLIACDACAVGLPTVTTEYRYHAPEREYLLPTFCRSSRENAAEYAALLVATLQDHKWLGRASQDAHAATDSFSIERMSQAMSDVIIELAG